MTERSGKCIQFGACPRADNKEIQKLAPGAEFFCDSCGKPLESVVPIAAPVNRKLFVVAAVLAVVLGAAWIYFRPPTQQAAASVMTPPEMTNSGPASTCGLKPLAQPDLTRLLTYLKQGMTYASQGRFQLALKEFQQIQQIDPNFLAMHENIAACQLKLRNLADAEKHLTEELKLIDCLEQTPDANLPAYAYMLEVRSDGTGDPAAARGQAMRKRLKQARSVAHYNLACVRARQGARSSALEELGRSVSQGFSDVAALKRDPDLAAIRSLPGFSELLTAASSAAAAQAGEGTTPR